MEPANLALTFLIALVCGATLALLSSLYSHVKFPVPSWVPRLSRRTSNILLLVFLSVYGIVFGAMSFYRHESFHSGGYDLGIFDQVVWNSLRGRPFENSIMLDSPSFLGHHFSPLLLALVPLYAVWSDPRMLLLLQTLALAIGVLPCYWWAREQLGNEPALLISACYLLFPAVQFINLFEFHEIALATPLLSFALFFLLKNRPLPLMVVLLLALSIKEEIAFVVAAVGLFSMFFQRNWKMGPFLVVAGLAWSILALLFMIPSFASGQGQAAYFFVGRYRYLGNDVPEIIYNAFSQPALLLTHLLTETKLEFLLQLLVPLAFVPLVGTEIFLLAVPTLGYLLLSDDPFQTSIRFQYTAPLLPFLFFALVLGFKRLRTRLPVLALPIAAAIFSASVTNYALQSPGPLSRNFDPTQYSKSERTRAADELVRQIPPDARVIAETDFVPHLSQRQFIYQAPNAPDLRTIDYVLADTRFPSYPEYRDIWDEVLTTPYFETMVEHDGFILRRRALAQPDEPLEVRWGERITLLGYDLASRSLISHQGNLSLILFWRADRDIRERYVVFVHLIDSQQRTVAQGDREPANGWLRTDRWQKGDLVPDRYQIELSEVPAGVFHLNIGLYDVATGARLVTKAGQDHIELGPIQVY